MPSKLQPGNINLFSRPRVVNPDGSVSTVRSMSFEDPRNGLETLIPTVEQRGRGILSDEDAIKQYYNTGEQLGQFNSPDEATTYAKQLHEDFAGGKYDVPLASSRKAVSPNALERALKGLLGQ